MGCIEHMKASSKDTYNFFKFGIVEISCPTMVIVLNLVIKESDRVMDL
jgi:hypothetical protein